MVKPNIHQIHRQLERMGIPISSVQLNQNGRTVSLVYLEEATDEQKLAAQSVADAWDQEAVDNANASAFSNLPSVEAINESKSVKALQAMALQLRDYIDAIRE